MALLKIHNDLLKQDPELLPFIEKEFQQVLTVSTIQDGINGFQAYLIQDPRIDEKCRELDLMISTADIPDYIHERAILGKYKGEYNAWFDDGSMPLPPIRLFDKSTTEGLRRSLDFQFDEYNKHTDPRAKALVMSFIKDIAQELERRKEN